MNNMFECKEALYDDFVNMKTNLSKEYSFDNEKKKLLKIHGQLHTKSVGKFNANTYYNFLWENLYGPACVVLSKKETSIAWNIWHITRIEDMISNILMADKDEIFDEHIQKELGITIKDTGNAMNASEVFLFSKQIDLKALKAYRKKVGISTQKILGSLQFSDLKRKVSKEGIEKIRRSGGVIDHEKSIWLLDFWGRKNMMGLITMPITKHQMVHLNDCFRIKDKYGLKS